MFQLLFQKLSSLEKCIALKRYVCTLLIATFCQYSLFIQYLISDVAMRWLGQCVDIDELTAGRDVHVDNEKVIRGVHVGIQVSGGVESV